MIFALIVISNQALQVASAQTQPGIPTTNTDFLSTESDNSLTSGALPSNVAPDSPMAQVIQLAQSGVDESVIMAYVTNFGGSFNLTSDQIIYLKDLGLPSDIVTAMIQHDQKFQQQTAQPAPNPATTDQTPPTQPAAVTENYFYDTLAPYGGWVNIDGYGLCWRPTVVIYDSGWQPYCDHGHWVYTDSGWYWLSDYSWGSTTFHYGRWFHNPSYGWCWWPDTTWAPSWVTWRYANDYCGWAPLPPHAVYRTGVGIVYNGVAVKADFSFGLSANFFTFVPTRNFCDPHPRHYRVTPTQAAQIYDHTTIINNFNFNNHSVVNNGIPPQHITAVSGVQIHPVPIHTTAAPLAHGAPGERFGQNGQILLVNRPHFVENTAPSLNQGVRPHPEVSNRNNNHNRLSQPSAPQNPPVGHPENSRANINEPENHNNLSAPTPPVNHSSPAPTPNYNSSHNNNHNTSLMPPKMQQQHQHQTPHAAAPTEHNQSSPVHSSSAPSGSQKSDRNENQNDSKY